MNTNIDQILTLLKNSLQVDIDYKFSKQYDYVRGHITIIDIKFSLDKKWSSEQFIAQLKQLLLNEHDNSQNATNTIQDHDRIRLEGD